MAQIIRTLEDAGVEFTNGARPGIRLRPKEAALLRFSAYVRAHPQGARGRDIPTPEQRERAHNEVLALVDEILAVETYQQFEKIRDELQARGIYADRETLAAVAAALPDLANHTNRGA